MKLRHDATTLADRLKIRLEWSAQRADLASRTRVLPIMVRIYRRGLAEGYRRALVVVTEEAQRCTN